MTTDFWEKDRKRILFLGASGSGKTALINVLLGEKNPVLPQSVMTEAITAVRWGEKRSARVFFRDPVTRKAQKRIPARAVNHIAVHNVPFSPVLVKDVPPMDFPWEDRREYIAPGEQKQKEPGEALPETAFSAVVLTAPVPFLKPGIALVDTYGLPEGEDPLLEQEIRRADLVVFVINGARTISPRETGFLRSCILEKGVRSLCFAVTHMDRITRGSERERIRKKLLSDYESCTDLGEEGFFFLELPGKGKAKETLDAMGQLLGRISGKEADPAEPLPREQISLAPHIAFAKQVIDQYTWSHQEYRNFILRLNEIQKKQQDKNLNLSIIGEFSSGKSTFINALLRMDLLAADVLQGTTVASTVLAYGPRYGITLQTPGAAQRVQGFSRVQEFQKRLNEIVANNDEAENMGEVLVSLPSRSLQNWGCRIIDTPGLNATVQWHEDVTVRTLQERSDLSIILVDAVRPLPEDLCLFIEEYLEPVLEQCIFVVTKMDLIPPRERSRMLKYVKRSVENKFGLENPLVLPYSSADVVNSFAPGSFPPGRYPSDVQDSFESETRILEYMARQRDIAQTKRLLALADMIYAGVEQQMQDLTQIYQQRLELLEQTRQRDLKVFVSEQKKICLRDFDEEKARLKKMLKISIPRYVDQAWDKIRENIDNQKSPEDLKLYLEKYVKKDCERQAENICKRIVNRTKQHGNLSGAADRILKAFRDEFQNQFRGLEGLVQEHRARIVVPPQIGLPDVRAIAEAEKYAKNMVKREGIWAGGGAAVGAALGSAVLPGVGTLVGMVLGFMGGRSGGKNTVNLQQMQDTVKAHLEASMRAYFQEAAEQTYIGVKKYAANIRGQISKEIDWYLKTYQTTVNQWICAEQTKKEQLEDKIRQIREDLQQIDLRRSSLDSLRKQIQPMQEEEE